MIKGRLGRLARRAFGVSPVPLVAASTWDGYTRDALALARVVDCSTDALRTPQQRPERLNPVFEQRTCNWYLPPFDNAFYGGVMTILRLSTELRSRGLRQRFLICGGADGDVMRERIAAAFAPLADAEIIILDSGDALRAIPSADYSFATLWTTAFVLAGVDNAALKFYMIQDFEPAFYPAGSTYAQAELSYRFGFYGICNTITLKELYERDYGGQAVVLRPSVDRTVFHDRTSLRTDGPRRLFYYARPGTPRNGFELAAAALADVKRRHGDDVDIVCAGTGWNPADYGLQDVVRTLGLLPYAETGDLYRSCHAGFVMMMTKHPSYLPFELMACGTTVVTNQNAANAWLLKDGENCLLSPPSANALAATLSYALDNHEALAGMRAAAASYISDTMPLWSESMADVIDFIRQPPSVPRDQPPFGARFTALRTANNP